MEQSRQKDAADGTNFSAFQIRLLTLLTPLNPKTATKAKRPVAVTVFSLCFWNSVSSRQLRKSARKKNAPYPKKYGAFLSPAHGSESIAQSGAADRRAYSSESTPSTALLALNLFIWSLSNFAIAVFFSSLLILS